MIAVLPNQGLPTAEELLEMQKHLRPAVRERILRTTGPELAGMLRSLAAEWRALKEKAAKQAVITERIAANHRRVMAEQMAGREERRLKRLAAKRKREEDLRKEEETRRLRDAADREVEALREAARREYEAMVKRKRDMEKVRKAAEHLYFRTVVSEEHDNTGWGYERYEEALENIRDEVVEVFRSRDPEWGRDIRHWSETWDEETDTASWYYWGSASHRLPSSRHAADRSSRKYRSVD